MGDGVPAAPADLHEQIAASLGGVQIIIGERLHGGQVHRLAIGDAEALVKQRCAQADGDGEPVGGDGLAQGPAVAGGAGIAVDGLGRAPGGEEPRLGGERLEQVDETGAVLGDDVEGRPHPGGLDRGGDAGLPRTVEGHRGHRRRRISDAGVGRRGVPEQGVSGAGGGGGLTTGERRAEGAGAEGTGGGRRDRLDGGSGGGSVHS